MRFAPVSPAANAYRILAEEIEKGIRETPTNQLYFILVRGYEALRQKNLQVAYAEFCRASEINSNIPQVWINRAYCAPTWDETMHSLARALLLEPESQEVRAGLEQRLNEKISNATLTDIPQMMGMAHYLEESCLTLYADPLYRRVTELDAQHSEGWLGRARTTPNSANAVAEIRNRLATDPNNYAARAALTIAKDRMKTDAHKLVDEGQALLQAGKRAEAHARFEQAVELDPQSDRAWVGRARTAEDWRKAYHYAKQALKINPENDDARLLYAASWDGGEPERPPARWRQIARYLVPVLIFIIGVALVVIKLVLR
jgi:tetratricopeptide (TPR) repeat protein